MCFGGGFPVELTLIGVPDIHELESITLDGLVPQFLQSFQAENPVLNGRWVMDIMEIQLENADSLGILIPLLYHYVTTTWSHESHGI